jgi:hypothetical protein
MQYAAGKRRGKTLIKLTRGFLEALQSENTFIHPMMKRVLTSDPL